MSELEAIADGIEDLARRLDEAIFAVVRAQLRDHEDDIARETEKRLARARRSLAKAAGLVRGSPALDD